jgi:tRNA (guanine37-N1)-methyltransferase
MYVFDGFMRIDVLTLFPAMFQGPLTESILQRAKEQGLLDVRLHHLRDFGVGKHHQVDDTPYGGGAGMVFRPDVVIPAIEAVMEKISNFNPQISNKSQKSEIRNQKPYRIYLSPRGKRLTQTKVERLAKKQWLLLLCGHYEGIDQRIVDGGWIDEEISIGDYVLTGGELPAMVLIDALARQIPGVLGKEISTKEESFSKNLGRKREYPHYTRPEEFRSQKVPEILLSGNHKKIEEWRRKNVR